MHDGLAVLARHRQAQGDQAPRRGAGDEIEQVGDRLVGAPLQLGQGKLGETRIFSEEQANEMFSPHTILPNGEGSPLLAARQPLFQAYALAWRLKDYRGRKLVHHSGGLAGMTSLTTLLVLIALPIWATTRFLIRPLRRRPDRSGLAILLERNKLTSGTTWHSAAQVRALRSSRNLTDLIKYSIALYGELEKETGQASGFLGFSLLIRFLFSDLW